MAVFSRKSLKNSLVFSAQAGLIIGGFGGQAKDYYIQKADLKGSTTDILLRFYLIRYLSFAAGLVWQWGGGSKKSKRNE